MKRIAVIGLGIFGKTLARALAEAGKEVLAIDSDLEEVQALAGSDVHVAVCLNATDLEALKAQGLGGLDAAVVSISEDFEANLMAAYHCLELGIPRVVMRVASPLQKQIVQAVGIRDVLLPEEDAAHRLAYRLDDQGVLDHVPLAPGVAIDQIEAPKHFHDRSVAEIALRQKHGVTLVAVRRDDDPEHACLGVPGPEYVIREGDILIVIGRDEDLEELVRT